MLFAIGGVRQVPATNVTKGVASHQWHQQSHQAMQRHGSGMNTRAGRGRGGSSSLVFTSQQVSGHGAAVVLRQRTSTRG